MGESFIESFISGLFWNRTLPKIGSDKLELYVCILVGLYSKKSSHMYTCHFLGTSCVWHDSCKRDMTPSYSTLSEI